MNKVSRLSAAYNWYELFEKIDYCKKHSSEETYKKVLKSFIGLVCSIVAICLLYAVVLISGMNYFDKQINSHVNEKNIVYSSKKTGHVRGGELYYIDNVKYEVDMSDYGYCIDDYESGTDFRIFLDENHKVVDISPINENEITPSDKMVYWMVGSLLGAAFVLILYTIWTINSKSILNPGKEWNRFRKWLDTKAVNEEWYYG